MVSSAAMGGGIVSIVSPPVMMGAAYLVGVWIGKRQGGPNERDVTVGCWTYVVLCIVVARLFQQLSGIIFAIIGGAGVAFLLHTRAVRGLRRLAIPASTYP